MKLTEKQNEIVQKEGLITLSACPGSGKTFVVANRVLRIINEKVISNYQGVAAISFTKIARDSIRESYMEINGTSAKYPHFIGTFDSFLNQYIFQPFSHLISNNNKPMKILDIDSGWLTEKIFPKFKSENIFAEKVIYKIDGSLAYIGNHVDQEKLKIIKNKTKELNLATQSDVNYYSLEILRRNTKIVKAIIKKFPYIIVDEAQDCSDIQMEIINTLVKAGHNQIMLSGDPYQSIYEWRDAKPILFIEKTKDKDWQHLSLKHNQRSGQAICDILNKFVDPGDMITDPDRTNLADAEVCYIESAQPTDVLIQFTKLVEAKGIIISPENVAILYRSHGSVMNIKDDINCVNEWWAGSINNIDMLGTTGLPIKIAYLMKIKNFAEAYKYAQQFYFFQINRELIKNTDENKVLFNNIEVKKILWRFCRNLPSLEQNLDEWIISTNHHIQSKFEELVKLGIVSINSPILIKKKRGYNENPDIWEIMSGHKIEKGKILIENIHQIKGRSFEAALIYVESSNKKAMSSQRIKDILITKEMFNNKIAEDGRCFYVAVSRAKRLLCIATVDKGLIELLS